MYIRKVKDGKTISERMVWNEPSLKKMVNTVIEQNDKTHFGKVEQFRNFAIINYLDGTKIMVSRG